MCNLTIHHLKYSWYSHTSIPLSTHTNTHPFHALFWCPCYLWGMRIASHNIIEWLVSREVPGFSYIAFVVEADCTSMPHPCHDSVQHLNAMNTKWTETFLQNRCLFRIGSHFFEGIVSPITNVVMAASYNWPRSLPAVLLRVLLVYSG